MFELLKKVFSKREEADANSFAPDQQTTTLSTELGPKFIRHSNGRHMKVDAFNNFLGWEDPPKENS